MRAPLLVALFLAACGGSPAPDCPNDLPKACPSPQPGYADVAPVIQALCLKCHSGAGPGNGDFRTYLGVQSAYLSGALLNQFYSCRMPPSGEPQPTPEQRALLLGWLVCGAPQ